MCIFFTALRQLTPVLTVVIRSRPWPLCAWLLLSLTVLNVSDVGAQSRSNSQAQLTPIEFAYGAVERSAYLFQPSAYRRSPGRTFPLLIALHGGGGTAIGFAEQSRLNDAAEQKEFLILYPQGISPSRTPNRFATWNSFDCCGTALEQNADDVGYVRALLERVEKQYRVDPMRVYATGISNGGMMSFKLACELGDRIAAVAMVAAPAPNVRECSDRSRPAVAVIHGRDDRCATFDGGTCGGCFHDALCGISPLLCPRERKVWTCPSIPSWVDSLKAWRGLDSASEKKQYSGPTVCTHYRGPAGDAGVRIREREVVFCEIEDHGHTWPGGTYGGSCSESPKGRACRSFMSASGALNSGFNANDWMLEWFNQHLLATPSDGANARGK